MSKPKLNDLIRRECVERFGIKPHQIRIALHNPDRTEDFGPLRLKTRYNPLAGVGLLVLEDKSKGEPQPHYVFKTYPNLVPDLETVPPSTLFKILMDRFGLPIRVGNAVGKLILNQKIPYPEGQDCSILEGAGPVPKDHSFTPHVLMRTVAGPPRHIEVFLAYSLDTTLYEEYLAASRLN